MRIHARAKGIEPITGTRYSANNPDAQLWIHVTGWHSVLKCYERYGPGPLSARQEESRIGRSRASPPSCRPASPPMFRRHVTRCGSTSPTSAAGSALLNTPTAQCITCCGRRATEACGCGRAAEFSRLPRSRPCRDGCGTWVNFDQPAAVDVAVTPVARALVRALSANNSRPMLAMARRLVPKPPRCSHSTSAGTAGTPAHHHARRGPRAARACTPETAAPHVFSALLRGKPPPCGNSGNTRRRACRRHRTSC